MKRLHDKEAHAKARAEENLRMMAIMPSMSDELAEMMRIVDLKEIFRMHPWQLVRLTNTNKVIREIVEFREKEEYTFWYHICKHSFPDACIAAYEKNRGEDNYSGLVFMNRYGSYAMRGLSFSHTDRTFTDSDILEKCTDSPAYAREVAFCFKALYPFGVPPSQYYFVSQWHLNEMALRLRTITEKLKSGTIYDTWLREVASAHTTGARGIELQSITLDSLMGMIKEEEGGVEVLYRGKGPIEFKGDEQSRKYLGTRTHDYRRITPSEIYTFVDLYHDIKELMTRFDGSLPEYTALKELQKSVVLFACLYDENATEFIDKAENAGAMASIKDTREKRMEKYGTIDPLVKDMMINEDEISMRTLKDNEEWKETIMKEIDWVKKYRGPNDLEYTTISSKCFSCANTDLSVLHVEPIAPFNFFCNDVCRSKKQF